MRRTTEELEERFDRWMLWFMPAFFTVMSAIVVICVVGMIVALVVGGPAD